MPDQDEAGGKRRPDLQWWPAGVGADGVLVINAISDHFTMGDAADAALIEGFGCTFVQMDAAMPQAISTDGVKPGPSLA